VSAIVIKLVQIRDLHSQFLVMHVATCKGFRQVVCAESRRGQLPLLIVSIEAEELVLAMGVAVRHFCRSRSSAGGGDVTDATAAATTSTTCFENIFEGMISNEKWLEGIAIKVRTQRWLANLLILFPESAPTLATSIKVVHEYTKSLALVVSKRWKSPRAL
jgi:hypothetical protein